MSILYNTIGFLASLILFALFICVGYGILIDQNYFSYLGDIIADLLFRFLTWFFFQIIFPIASFFGCVKGLIWLFSGSKEEIVYEWNPPTLSENSTQNTPGGQEIEESRSRVGEKVVVEIGNKGYFVEKGSKGYYQKLKEAEKENGIHA